MVRIKTPLNLITWSVTLTGVGPLYIWLSLPAQILLPVALIIGVYCERQNRYFIHAHAATLLSIIFFLFYASQLTLTDVVTPVVNTLALLLAVRLVTEKNSRNYLQIFMLALFSLASSSMFSLSIIFFPALVLLVFGVTIGLMLLTFYSKAPEQRFSIAELYTILRTAVILPLISLLLMLLFFVILPRTQYPLWNILNPGGSASSGFSEEVRPGAFASNAAVKILAFRAECRKLPANMLYWRGTVLNVLHGTVWSRADSPGEAVRAVGGERVPCTIYLPAKTSQFLFTLDHPQILSGIWHTASDDLVFLARRPLIKNSRFQCTSTIGGKLQLLDSIDKKFYLEVPENLSQELHRVADNIGRTSHSPHETISLLENFFRRQNLTYATYDLPGRQAPIDEFLFTKKRGYCEYFASSFALLLRMTGIPSRLVGGYLGGDYNNMGGYYRVTEDMAHVWVEALVDGSWIRLEPSQLAQNFSTPLMGSGRHKFSLLQRTMDAIDYFWTQAIITYDFRKQFSLARRTGKGLQTFAREWNWNMKKWVPLSAIPLLLFIFWKALRWQRTDRKKKILKRYIRALRKKHSLPTIPPTMGLYELATQLQDPLCEQFAAIFGAALYSEHTLTEEEYHTLQTIIHLLEKEKDSSR